MTSTETTTIHLASLQTEEQQVESSTEEGSYDRQAPLNASGALTTGTEAGPIHPADRGKNAWLFLAASFLIVAFVWGFCFSYGIFQEYYGHVEPFNKDAGSIAIIGTTASGIMYMAAPVLFMALIKFPATRRVFTFVGVVLMCAALVASSFARSTQELIAFQGVMYAVGGALTFAPTIFFMDEWFVRRKGLAFGIMSAGTGLAGLSLPFIFSAALNRWGFRVVLRAWAITIFSVVTPLLYFVKPRLPASPSRARKIHLGFLKHSVFLLMLIGVVIESMGYFLPGIFLPTYARTIGAAEFSSSLTLVLLNVASVIGCVIMGYLIDHFSVITCIGISTVGATMSVILIWGLSISLPPLYIFAIVYGLFAGSFSSTYPGIMTLISRNVAETEPLMIFAFLEAGRGLGNVISGPLSNGLLKADMWEGGSALGYSSGYGALILFTGITALLGGVSVLGRTKIAGSAHQDSRRS